jgi:hypothetical protein
MLVAMRSPLTVGVLRWPRGDIVTVVVKRSFDLTPRGVGELADDQAPLTLDHSDPAGLLLVPGDFAPTKRECDVVMIGPALLDARGPVRIALDPLRKLSERAQPLGPRAGVGPLGDPSDRAVTGDWTLPDFDFQRFQHAPPDQRIARPTLPLDVVLDVADLRFITRIEGPAGAVRRGDRRAARGGRRLRSAPADLRRGRRVAARRGADPGAPARVPVSRAGRDRGRLLAPKYRAGLGVQRGARRDAVRSGSRGPGLSTIRHSARCPFVTFRSVD